MIVNQTIWKSLEVRVQGLDNINKTTPAERRYIRPKARTKDKMISPMTRKPAFNDSSLEDEKQTDAIIIQLIKTTCNSNGLKEKLEDEGRPSLVFAECVYH